MGLFDDIERDAKREARRYLADKQKKQKWKCSKCGKVVESDDKPRKSIFSMANDPCPAAKMSGDWHEYRPTSR